MTLTGILIGCTECVAARLRNQMPGIERLEKAVAYLPFAMYGPISDGGDAFMDYPVLDHYKRHSLEQTRSHRNRKDDQAEAEPETVLSCGDWSAMVD